MALPNMKTSLDAAFSAVSDKLGDSMTFLAEMKEVSQEKMTTLVNDILGLAPLIEVTGFSMKELSVDIGIPPGVHIGFIKEKRND